jgi:ribosomal protein S18 acetylase RimI-like enzyme
MNIREFDYERDIQTVLDLWRNSGSGIQLSRSDEPEEIRKKLQYDPELFLVAEEGSQLLGAVLGGFDGRRGIVYHLAVKPSERRRGIGRALMRELEARLSRKDCLRYYLLVARNNQQALAFYEDLGCETLDLIVLGKDIQ